MIAAVDQNFGIGFQGTLLFYSRKDMAQFKEKTLGKTVIMGRKTFESLPGGKPLSDRENIVLSKKKMISSQVADGVILCSSLEDCLRRVEDRAADVFVIGGESVYRAFLPYVDEIFLTEVQEVREADVWFPKLMKSDGWKRKELEIWEEAGIQYRLCVYKRFSENK